LGGLSFNRKFYSNFDNGQGNMVYLGKKERIIMRFKHGKKLSRVEIIGKVAVENEKNTHKSEIGKFLIDTAKIILAVFVVDNVVTNRIISSTEMLIVGAGISLILFSIGLWLSSSRR